MGLKSQFACSISTVYILLTDYTRRSSHQNNHFNHHPFLLNVLFSNFFFITTFRCDGRRLALQKNKTGGIQTIKDELLIYDFTAACTPLSFPVSFSHYEEQSYRITDYDMSIHRIYQICDNNHNHQLFTSISLVIILILIVFIVVILRISSTAHALTLSVFVFFNSQEPSKSSRDNLVLEMNRKMYRRMDRIV